MAKKLHLICNAHLDPVWQWEWEEGAAEALSTFRIAADFCEEYDNFVFCHNEALLYKWIEEYDMPLFEHIKSLVKRGKWHIMGGWHVQPDCNMPSGEAFVRQIMSGREYFLEKFGVCPNVAINLDPFGHTRGLVQILTKTGYDGYLFMRPGDGDERFFKLPSNEFKWVGYDGSEVTAVRIHGGYNSGKGKAAEKIKEYAKLCKEDDFFLCLWGIGNHGGGPSKKDLDDIQVLTDEMKKDSVELIQSTPEMYIEAVKNTHELPEVRESLNPWAPGCYTSQVRVKQKYRQAENIYFFTESISSHAALNGLMEYPENELAQAMYDILTVQFHDILPGSSIQPAEEMGIRMLDHAIEILSRVKARAFFALASGQPKAPSDKIPFFAYNPYPYPVSGDFISEFMLWDQNWNKEFLMPVVYDEEGNILPAQCEKENSTIPLEWRKRVVFAATLKPMSLNRFECGFKSVPEKPVPALKHNDTHYIFDSERMHVEINRSTGLVDAYELDGCSYVKPGAFALEIFDDNYDPWYMDEASMTQRIDCFKLLTPEQAQSFCCTNAPLEGVHVIESGDVRTVVEALFGYNSARARVKYNLSEKHGLSIDVRIVWDEKQKLVKLNIPAAFETTECIGEHAYGREKMKTGLMENVSQKYLALCGADKAILAANNGVYGSSYDEKAGELKITLLRSPSYTAHPLPGRTVMPQDRYMPYIEQGERDFSFAFDAGERGEILDKAGRFAAHFNMQPMVLSFYPTGVGEKPASPVRLEETDVIQITTLKQSRDKSGWTIRLFNPTEAKQTCRLAFDKQSMKLDFGPYEIKTVKYDGSKLGETDMLEGLLSD